MSVGMISCVCLQVSESLSSCKYGYYQSGLNLYRLYMYHNTPLYTVQHVHVNCMYNHVKFLDMYMYMYVRPSLSFCIFLSSSSLPCSLYSFFPFLPSSNPLLPNPFLLSLNSSTYMYMYMYVRPSLSFCIFLSSSSLPCSLYSFFPFLPSSNPLLPNPFLLSLNSST